MNTTEDQDFCKKNRAIYDENRTNILKAASNLEGLVAEYQTHAPPLVVEAIAGRLTEIHTYCINLFDTKL